MKALIAACLCALVASAAFAADDAAPQDDTSAALFDGRLELGVGASVFAYPNYPGSDRGQIGALPFPYVRYTSERLRLGGEGARARLPLNPRASFSLSGSGSLPGGRDEPPRQGMPRLLPTLELGPTLDLELGALNDARRRYRLSFPLRAVIATDLRDAEAVGWVFNPTFRAGFRVGKPEHARVVSVSLGSRWANGDHHAYYYNVDNAFVTPERPGFAASGGYGGSSIGLSWSEGRKRWRWGVFGRYTSLEGARFRNSPLVKSDSAVAGGLFISYRLYQNRPAEGGVPTEPLLE
jgi:MipA family protein